MGRTMRWNNQAIVDNINMARLAYAAYESAFRAWMYMCVDDMREMPPPIKPSAYGCPNIDNKLAWNMWMEHYCQ